MAIVVGLVGMRMVEICKVIKFCVCTEHETSIGAFELPNNYKLFCAKHVYIHVLCQAQLAGFKIQFAMNNVFLCQSTFSCCAKHSLQISKFSWLRYMGCKFRAST